jgi:peptidyl-tRNA hydrolase
MSTALEPAPETAERRPGELLYLLNPRLEMSSGKTLAQIAHAAVMAADSGACEEWVAAGCPAQVAAPDTDTFDELCRAGDLAARVVDAGLTEVPPGTVTVVAA